MKEQTSIPTELIKQQEKPLLRRVDWWTLEAWTWRQQLGWGLGVERGGQFWRGGGAGKEVIETGFCTPLYSLKRREETHTHSMVRDICGLGGVGD